MATSDVFGTVLTIVLIALAALGLYALAVLVRTLRELREAVADVRIRLVPLLEKVDVTVDAVNAELLRLDAIVTKAEEVGDAVSSAGEVIRSPLNSAALGVARIIRSLSKHKTGDSTQ
jgi:ABC-type transporter Mla subunit MlaD